MTGNRRPAPASAPVASWVSREPPVRQRRGESAEIPPSGGEATRSFPIETGITFRAPAEARG
jgi:hypothetical protein